jgi:acetyl esterase/lipase
VRGIPLRPYITVAFIRALLLRLSPRQIQAASPPTALVYKDFIVSKSTFAAKTSDPILANLSYDVEVLSDGKSSISWLGDRKTATKLVLFFHGGGYIAPITPEHLEWALQYLRFGHEMHIDVAVAVLQYSLAPSARFPTQLCQAADALSHMLSSGISARDIIIGGDSAGGNLTVALLSHLVSPHPDARSIELKEPLGGAFTVSPWLSTGTSTSSFRDNNYVDMLSAQHMPPGNEAFWLDSAYSPKNSTAATALNHTSYAMPLDLTLPSLDLLSPSNTSDPCISLPFVNFSKATKNLYITAGGQEVFHDDVLMFARHVQLMDKDVNVTLSVGAKEAHDWILVESGIKGLRGKGDSTRRMEEWVKGVWARG